MEMFYLCWHHAISREPLSLLRDGLVKALHTASKSKGPLCVYFVMPMTARGCLTMNLTICHAISEAPSFFLGKGLSGAETPKNLRKESLCSVPARPTHPYQAVS